jgi:hypothetical protein
VAIVALSLKFMLCNFHMQQAWRHATTQFCKPGTNYSTLVLRFVHIKLIA